MAGLDILTDGDARFDNDVGGRSWFFYPLERLGGFTAYNDGVDAWRSFTRPGEILWEVMESYRPRTLTERVSRGPLQYAAVWKVGQRLTTKPLKFGAIAVDSVTHMMVNEAYEDERELVFDFADIFQPRVQRASRGRLSDHPDRGAASSYLVAKRERGPRSNDGNVQPAGRRRRHGNMVSYLLGQPRHSRLQREI